MMTDGLTNLYYLMVESIDIDIDINRNKRRKIAPHPNIVIISDIPDEALATVAAFLPPPSRALFAAAIATPLLRSPFAWKLLPSAETNRAILSLDFPKTWSKLGNNDGNGCGAWSTLDFSDVEETLARKLTDDDIRGALICIDGKNRLKKLRLTGCSNVTGTGLMPLMGSTVLEQIDLSIVKTKASERESPVPQISEHCVIPILISIVGTTETCLRHVQLPKKFRCRPSAIIDSFIEKYDEVLEEERGGVCSKCDFDEPWGNMDGGGNPWVFESHTSPFYGLQNYTCYECTTHVCIDNCLQFCTSCEKSYCTSCMAFTVCRYCPSQLCNSCGTLTTCKRCNWHACDSCSSMGECNQKSCWLPGIPPFCGERGMR